MNGGVCKPAVENQSCAYIDEYYEAQYCEIERGNIRILKFFSRLMTYVAIIIIAFFVLFFIGINTLKYILRMDISLEEREEIRQNKNSNKGLAFRCCLVD